MTIRQLHAYRRHKPARADSTTTQVKIRHIRPSFAALTTKMFPRDLLLMLLFTCILYCHCYAQETTTVPPKILTALSDTEIISTAMVCAMFSVLIVLVPTVLYYRYCSKEKIDE